MAFAGLALAVAGFALAVASLGITTSNSARLILVLVGIAISLGGIMGPLNQAYQKNAIWKR